MSLTSRFEQLKASSSGAKKATQPSSFQAVKTPVGRSQQKGTQSLPSTMGFASLASLQKQQQTMESPKTSTLQMEKVLGELKKSVGNLGSKIDKGVTKEEMQQFATHIMAELSAAVSILSVKIDDLSLQLEKTSKPQEEKNEKDEESTDDEEEVEKVEETEHHSEEG